VGASREPGGDIYPPDEVSGGPDPDPLDADIRRCYWTLRRAPGHPFPGNDLA